MCTGRPRASHAASARARRSARASVGSIGGVLVDPAALPVAVDGRGAEIAGPGERRQRAEVGAVRRRAPGSPASSGAIEVRTWVTPASALRAASGCARSKANMRPAARRQRRRLLGPARRAADLPALGGEAAGQHVRPSSRGRSRAGCRSDTAVSSHSAPDLRRRARRAAGLHAEVAQLRGREQAAPAPRPPSPRTSGAGSSSRRSAAGARAGSPLLPIAISTLRTKRSRPMRLTGRPREAAPEGRVVEARRARPAAGPRGPVARLQLQLAAAGGRTCSTGRRRGSRRSHRCGCR